MTNYRRLRLNGATYFFTLCLQDRGSTALTDHIDTLRFAYARTVAELPVRCEAMVVLPDHLHAVWTLPDGDADFSERWRRIKARFSLALPEVGRPSPSMAARRERGLWQRRFWEHAVRGPEELADLVNYCRINPVKHGLVADAADWPYSSVGKQAAVAQAMGRTAHPTPMLAGWSPGPGAAAGHRAGLLS